MLADVRHEINGIDDELIPLLVRRLRLADDVAAAKRAEGRAIDDPVRETAILESMVARVPADCAEAMTTVYRTIFACSKARQRAGLGAGSDVI